MTIDRFSSLCVSMYAYGLSAITPRDRETYIELRFILILLNDKEQNDTEMFHIETLMFHIGNEWILG